MTPASIHDFGAALISTRDLDPLYCSLVDAKLPKPQLYRYLLAYWSFYHVGVSAWLSELEGQEFWIMFLNAAENKEPPSNYSFPGERWPRGSERRHFRGPRCVDAGLWFCGKFPRPEDAVKSLIKKRGDYAIMEAARSWPMFGNWISFKVVDMLERCCPDLQIPPMAADLVLMYDEPYKALEILAPETQLSAQIVYKGLLEYFSAFKAPPHGDRPCGPQEVETILCKWKSSLSGHYFVGKDIKEQRHALVGWGATAASMLQHYPPEVNLEGQRRLQNNVPGEPRRLRGVLF